MKKFVIALVACLALGASAFAKGKDSFSIGYTYGFMNATSDNGSKMKASGSGLYIDDYSDFSKFFGMGVHGYFMFYGNPTVNGVKYDYTKFPISIGLTLMPAFNLPIGDFLNLRVGAGIGFMMVNAKNTLLYTTRSNSYMFTFPVGVSAQFKFGNYFGLKTGCDFQFKFAGWTKNSSGDESEITAKYNFINPYVAFTILY